LAIRLQPHIHPSLIHPAGRARRSDKNLALFSDVHTERATASEPTNPGLLIIVGAAIVAEGKVLGCERAEPPESAGRWEFPGGKVEPGESDIDALVRECEEELGVTIAVGQRIGGDVLLAHGRAVLRVWLSEIVHGQPQALEHASLRWLAPDEFDAVPWLPADAPIVAQLAEMLRNVDPV
jgi:8-oxo-dGTP diphosphatase